MLTQGSGGEPILKRGQWQLQEEWSSSWHPTPQINCCILGPARETGLAWKGKPGSRQEFGPLGDAINSQRESEGLQGRGWRGRSSRKGNCQSSVQGDPGHSPQCMDVAGVKDSVFREEHAGSSAEDHVCAISQHHSENFHHTVHPHATGLREPALIPHFHPFGHPGMRAITQPVSQAGTLRTIQRC